MMAKCASVLSVLGLEFPFAGPTIKVLPDYNLVELTVRLHQGKIILMKGRNVHGFSRKQ